MRRPWSVLAVAGLLAACSGSTSPRATSSTGAPSAAPAPAEPVSTEAPVAPVGFERTVARVVAADGEVCDLCVWLADTSDRRSLGLMYATTLGPADAMAFVYPQPTTSEFWMKNTLLPLSIAFFAADGAFLDSFDMAPCQRDTCPRYPTARDFTVALETTQGRLPEFLIGPGATLTILDLPCNDI